MANVAVTFTVECSCTEHGEEVYVVGSHKKLGAWDPLEAVRCTTTAENFPRWTSSPVSLTNGSRIEFKTVIRGPGGKKWEHGQNRLLQLSVPSHEARTNVAFTWGQPGVNEEDDRVSEMTGGFRRATSGGSEKSGPLTRMMESGSSMSRRGSRHLCKTRNGMVNEEMTRTPNELKALLQSKGLHCDECDKAQLVQRVLDTWDDEVFEASSPDGKIRLTKDVFMKDLKMTYKKHMKRRPEDGGHELADEEDADSADTIDSTFPDFSKEWREFSVKLAKGDVQTESDGQIVYEVGGPTPAPTFWDRWKMHLLMGMNISMLMCTQYLKRYKTHETQERSAGATRAEVEAEGEEFEESKKSDKQVKKKKDSKKKS